MSKFKNPDLDYMLPHLKLAGVTKITVSFDGSGDSGEITDITAKNFDLEVQCPGKQDSYERLLSAVMGAYLEDKEDWYNNDGGYGSITIDLTHRTIQCDMNIRITNIEEYTYEDKI